MRVFISEASRKQAHNLDDLHERWVIRHDIKTKDYELTIPDRLPKFADSDDAYRFRNELVFVRNCLEAEIKKGKYQKNYYVLLDAHNRINALQQEINARIKQINKVENPQKTNKITEYDKAINDKARLVAALIHCGELLIHRNGLDVIFVFPQNETVVVLENPFKD